MPVTFDGLRFHGVTEPVRREDRGYSSDCLVWQRSTVRGGYGLLRRNGQHHLAHRFFYERARGVIADGMDLHHRCGVPGCVNPDHLEPMTVAAHMRRHSRLSEDDVREIRHRHQPRRITYKHLASEYGVSPHTIEKIVRGATWREEERACRPV